MKKISVFLRVAIRCNLIPMFWETIAQFCEFCDIYIGWIQNLAVKHLKK